MTVAATSETFAGEVLHSAKPVLVDFWAAWCPPCRKLGPILDQLSEEQADRLTVVKVNVDEQPELAQQFGIRSLPTLKLFNSGEVIHQIVGALPKHALLAELEGHL